MLRSAYKQPNKPQYANLLKTRQILSSYTTIIQAIHLESLTLYELNLSNH